MQSYDDFRFYLFDAKDFRYFALIWAATPQGALRIYREEVCEEDEGEVYDTPSALTFIQGLKEIVKSTSEDLENDDIDAFHVLRNLFSNEENQVILISSDLL